MNIQSLCRCFAALADVERLYIIDELRSETTPLPYPALLSRIRNKQRIAQSTVSYRLRVLVDAGIVKRHSVDGHETFGEGAHFAYSLVPGVLRTLALALASRDVPREKEQAS